MGRSGYGFGFGLQGLFTPLPIQLGAVAWYNFTDSSKIVEGATSVDVAGWKDSETSTTYDLSQSSSSAQPAFTQPDGPVVLNGSDYLEGVPIPSGGNATWVFKFIATSSGVNILLGTDSSTSQLQAIWIDTSDDTLKFRTESGIVHSVSSGKTLLNADTFVALTKATNTYQFYIDGQPVGSTIVDAGAMDRLSILFGRKSFSSNRFTGSFEDSEVYSSALTASEITQLNSWMNQQ
jgi:hypothetical protein